MVLLTIHAHEHKLKYNYYTCPTYALSIVMEIVSSLYVHAYRERERERKREAAGFHYWYY